MFNESLSKVKKSVITAKNKTVTFCKAHKTEITMGCGIVLLGSACIYLVKNNNGQKVIIEKLLSENKSLKFENKNLLNSIDACTERNVNLVDLCLKKDEIMKATMFDGLRCGSSVAAQQMAYKRWS